MRKVPKSSLGRTTLKSAPFLFRHNCPSPSLRPLTQAYSLILSRSSKRAHGTTTTNAWRRSSMPLRGTLRLSNALLSLVVFSGLTPHPAQADEPKPKPENTITIQPELVAPQKFERPPKFWIADITDRSGNPQPLLVMKERGGVFLDKQPTAIMKDALEQSLKAANLLAADSASADLVLRVYLFHFGLASGSALDFFGKVEFSNMVKNPKSGESLEVQAVVTSS